MGVVTLLILSLFFPVQLSSVLPIGLENFFISFIEFIIPFIFELSKINLSNIFFLLRFFTSFKFSLIIFFSLALISLI